MLAQNRPVPMMGHRSDRPARKNWSEDVCLPISGQDADRHDPQQIDNDNDRVDGGNRTVSHTEFLSSSGTAVGGLDTCCRPECQADSPFAGFTVQVLLVRSNRRSWLDPLEAACPVPNQGSLHRQYAGTITGSGFLSIARIRVTWRSAKYLTRAPAMNPSAPAMTIKSSFWGLLTLFSCIA